MAIRKAGRRRTYKKSEVGSQKSEVGSQRFAGRKLPSNRIGVCFSLPLSKFRPMMRSSFSIVALTLITTAFCLAQDDDIDAQIKKAMENANKPASKADMNKVEEHAKAQIDQAEAQTKADEAKQKAAAQAVVDAPGPTSLPNWTPEVPQFTPSGPPVRKVVDGQPMVIVTGTSPLSAEALCDAWDKFSNPKFSHERTGSELNHNADLFVSFRNSEDGTQVKMEAERKAGAKITHVTLSSPLPMPSPATELGN